MYMSKPISNDSLILGLNISSDEIFVKLPENGTKYKMVSSESCHSKGFYCKGNIDNLSLHSNSFY